MVGVGNDVEMVALIFVQILAHQLLVGHGIHLQVLFAVDGHHRAVYLFEVCFGVEMEQGEEPGGGELLYGGVFALWRHIVSFLLLRSEFRALFVPEVTDTAGGLLAVFRFADKSVQLVRELYGFVYFGGC